MDDAKAKYPNFVHLAAEAVWRSQDPEKVADPPHRVAVTKAQKERNALVDKRESLRIGIPRVLNQYSVNPLFSAYFESLA